ncbi:MAG: tRNA (adenosine(37)-N6)-threonylcarbamoyltransferase complex ATPase subunit type 1 TsaE [Verrucomicrobiota bacterium]
MKTSTVSPSPEWTESYAARLASRCAGGTVLALFGNLGAGKSVFARGFARGLGITEPVTSPTFALVQEYPCPDGKLFVHADMYRINDPLEIAGTGLEEHMFAPATITLVEWAERIEEALLPDRAKAQLLRITLEHAGECRRKIFAELPE